MVFRATYLFFISIFFFLCAGTSSSFARQSLGIVWEIPESETETTYQLDQFSNLGIDFLELTHPIDRNLLSLLSQYDFSVMVRSDEKFYTQSELEFQQRRLRTKFSEISDAYNTNFNVTAIGLLSNSQLYEQEQLAAFTPLLDSLSVHSNKSFYFVQNKSWYNFSNPFTAAGQLISSQNFETSELSKLNSAFADSLFTDTQAILFLHSTWLLEGVEEYPPLQQSLEDYQKSGVWLLPLPNIAANSRAPNWSVLILLALWAGFAAQLKYVPVSGPMILRYFLAHRFFADDILHYRERSAAGGIIVMIQHAIFGGLLCYILATTFISEIGLQALFDHLPGLGIVGNNYYSFFFLGIISLLILQIIALFWIYLPNKSLEHFSQVINLYSGIFYLDFIIVTMMLTFFLSGTGTTMILVLGILYVLFWFSAFYIAAGDASKYMGSGKVIYLLLTVGLHTAATALLIILFLNSSELLEVLDLAVNL
ncbi:MAG: hypothetical protein WD016_08250 [Balneolaceae bacterium]